MQSGLEAANVQSETKNDIGCEDANYAHHEKLPLVQRTPHLVWGIVMNDASMVRYMASFCTNLADGTRIKKA